MKLRYTAQALHRLRQILEFNGGGLAGKKVVKEILNRADILERYPELGKKEIYLKNLGQGHRFLLLGRRYKIIYFIDDSLIVVTDIFDVRQDPEKMKPE